MYPRSGFRSRGTSAETTLLETTLLSTPGMAYWEIKGRFPKGWFWRTYPRSGFFFSFRGNIRQNHPFGNHPFVNPRRGSEKGFSERGPFSMGFTVKKGSQKGF